MRPPTPTPRRHATALRLLLTAALLAGCGAARAQPAPVQAPAAAPIAAAPIAAAPIAAEARSGTPAYTLSQLLAVATQSSPLLAVGRADVAVADAATITARAYPNPELAIEPGRLRPRGADATSGASTLLSISQPIENPLLREARQRAALGGVDVARARSELQRANLMSAIRTRFFDIVRLEDEMLAYREDLQLTEQIRDRVLARVRIGEAPRFDQVRAEGEVEAARKNLVTARARRLQAIAELRTLVGPSLPPDFEVRNDPGAQRAFARADYEALRETVAARNPEVGLAQRGLAQAEQQIEVERRAVWPQLTLRAASERDPDAAVTRIGAQVTLPLLNRREGPIAEARAQAERARLALEQRRFEAGASFDAAWQGHEAALSRVRAIEGGILERARSALEIAEAAYRLGERGILEYLDAQRQFRLVRNELISARFDLQSARSEMERLLGTP